MTNTWILIGCMAVVAVVLLYRVLSGRSRRKFPAIPPSTQDKAAEAEKAVSAPLQAASDAAFTAKETAAASTAEAFRKIGETKEKAVETAAAAGAAVSAGAAAAVGSVMSSTTEAGRGAGRTWDDQRLFSSFHGIVSDQGTNILPPPAPEDLPIPDDQLLYGSATPAMAQLLPESEQRRTRQRQSLTAAGYRSRASWLNLNATRFLLPFLAILVIGFWLIVGPPQMETYLLGAVVIVPLLLWALPPVFVASRARERTIDIERGLPDVLDMLNMGVSQGLTVPQSLKRIAREIKPGHPALAEELSIVTKQADMGSMPQALKNFSNRIESPEVASFTNLLIQSETTGTAISSALHEYSDSIRSTLRERADSQSNSASFKLLFPVTLCLMPSIFLFLMGPAIVELNNFVENQAPTLEDDRNSSLNSLQQQPTLDLSRFRQNGF